MIEAFLGLSALAILSHTLWTGANQLKSEPFQALDIRLKLCAWLMLILAQVAILGALTAIFTDLSFAHLILGLPIFAILILMFVIVLLRAFLPPGPSRGDPS